MWCLKSSLKRNRHLNWERTIANKSKCLSAMWWLASITSKSIDCKRRHPKWKGSIVRYSGKRKTHKKGWTDQAIEWVKRQLN
jgi:hypothetical protein